MNNDKTYLALVLITFLSTCIAIAIGVMHWNEYTDVTQKAYTEDPFE